MATQRVALQGRTDERIESLLSARLFLEPHLAGGRLYFISNLSGHLSLFAMDADGGVPEPLLPPQIALQNPELIGGESFFVLPELDRIVVMIDRDGDENYRPFTVPLEGGFPEPLAGDRFEGYRSHLADVDPDTAIAYFAAESREESKIHAIRCLSADRRRRRHPCEHLRSHPRRMDRRRMAHVVLQDHVPDRRRRPVRDRRR